MSDQTFPPPGGTSQRRINPPVPGPSPSGVPAAITFNGREIVARDGESLLAALLAGGVGTLRTMPRSGEPRGGYCGVGRCTDCLVQVDGAPNVRACVTPTRAGMRVATQHGLGEFAAAAVASAGEFRSSSSRSGEPMLGGDDAIGADAARPAGERGEAPPIRSCQVAVVGGGPAGLAAAIAAAGAGADVVLLDEWPVLGGRLRYEVAPVVVSWVDVAAPVSPPRLADRLVAEATALGVDLRPAAIAWGLFPETTLAVASAADPAVSLAAGPPDHGSDVAGKASSFALRPEVLILATGATDASWSFAGGTLPGVWSARAVEMLLNRDRVRVGERVAIVGSGPEANALAATIRLAGAEVAVMIDPLRSTVVAEGRGRVDAVVVGGDRIAVDVVAVAVGRQPDAALAMMGAAAFAFDEALGGHVPLLDDRLRSSLPNVVVAGDAAGPTDPATALAEGRLAGLGAAALLGLATDELVVEARLALRAAAGDRVAARYRARPIAVRPESDDALPGAGGDRVIIAGPTHPAAPTPPRVVCRCEEIAESDVRAAIIAGARTINDVKRQTKAGMGLCQGIFCVSTIAALLAAETGQAVAAIEPMTARPPVRPLPLDRLAPGGA